MADCLSCGAERGESLVCNSCGALQPVTERTDYFSALGLEPRMSLRMPELDRAFRSVSKGVHPDRFPRDNSELRKRALRATEVVNQGYKTLKDPQKRGEYLLKLAGCEVATETERTEDQNFLLELLEQQEEIQMADESETVAELKSKTRARFDRLILVVTDYFDDGRGHLDDVRRALIELRYLRRMLDQIALKEDELF